MSNSEATVHLTKIAAAKRQLDTAIRLYFAHDDELSIHTLVAAAFRILRDLIDKRGTDFEAELFRAGFYAMAKQYRGGTLSEDVSNALKESGLLSLLETIADDEHHVFRIIRDKKKSRGWPSGPANFLKHADLDADALLAANDINNEDFLIGACTAYLELMPTLSPEMMAFIALWAVEHDTARDGWYKPARKLADRLVSIKKDERYRACAEWVRLMKN
jgi:hypothetical protein